MARIRHHARQMIGTAGYTPSDQDDLEQELLLRLLERQSSFDPEQGKWSTFVASVLRRQTISLVRKNLFACRSTHQTTSLHEREECSDGIITEVLDHLNQRDLDRHRGVERLSEHEHQELVMDLTQLISKMPGELRQIAERLQHQTVQEIVNETGTPRTTLRRRIEEIRDWLNCRNPGLFSHFAASF